MTPITAAPTSVPVISGDRVFLASLPGVVSVHDIKDGRELWREPINPEQPIAVEGPLVFIASGEAIQALQVSDRAVAWRASTGTITAPLTVKEGWVIAASETRMVALRASDGSKVWERANGATARAGGDRRQHSVRAARQRPHSGDQSRRWQTTLGDGNLAAHPQNHWWSVTGSTSEQPTRYFYGLDASNGEEEWRIRVGSSIRGRASTDGERVFFAGLDNLIRAHGRSSGSQRWQHGVRFRPFAAPAVAAGSIFVAGPVNEVTILNAATGDETGKLTFPEPLVTAPAVGMSSAGEVLVAAITGGLNESWKLWLASPAAAKPSGTPKQ